MAGLFLQYSGTIESLTYSSVLKVDDNSCLNINNHDVLKFSKNSRRSRPGNGKDIFEVSEVNYIINWKKEQDEEIRIVLPEVYFENIKAVFNTL